MIVTSDKFLYYLQEKNPRSFDDTNGGFNIVGEISIHYPLTKSTDN